MDYWTWMRIWTPVKILSTAVAADPDFFCVCSEALEPADPCSVPVDPGTCGGAERRFAYNPAAKRCRVFSYSGCGGNENNFKHRRSCIAKCIKGRRGRACGIGVGEVGFTNSFWNKLNTRVLLCSGAAHRRKIIRIRKKNIDYLVNRSTWKPRIHAVTCVYVCILGFFFFALLYWFFFLLLYLMFVVV